MTEQEKWESIKSQLNNQKFRDNMKENSKENDSLRYILSEFWRFEEFNFKKFWDDINNSQIKDGIVLASLEELPQITFGPLLAICCDELLQYDALTKDSSKISQIIETIIFNKENDNIQESLLKNFPILSETDELSINNEEFIKTLEPLKIARTILLIRFLCSVILLYQQLDTTSKHIDLDKIKIKY